MRLKVVDNRKHLWVRRCALAVQCSRQCQKLTLSFVSGQTMTFSYKGDTQYAVGDNVRSTGSFCLPTMIRPMKHVLSSSNEVVS